MISEQVIAQSRKASAKSMAETSSSKIIVVQVKEKDKLTWAQVVALPCNKANDGSLACAKGKSTQLEIKSCLVQRMLDQEESQIERNSSLILIMLQLSTVVFTNNLLLQRSRTLIMARGEKGREAEHPLDAITVKDKVTRGLVVGFSILISDHHRKKKREK
jgi:hypothetical protein